MRLTENVLKELVTELNADRQTRCYLSKEDLRIRKYFRQEIKVGAKAQR